MMSNKVKKWFYIVMLMFLGYCALCTIPAVIIFGIYTFNTVETNFLIIFLVGGFFGMLPFGVVCYFGIIKCLKSIKVLSMQDQLLSQSFKEQKNVMQ